jgi:hypothetical protein
MDKLVVRAIHYRHGEDGQFPQPGRERQSAADGPKQGVPAQREGRAVQQHAVQVQQVAPAPGADGGDKLRRFVEITRLVWNTGHPFKSFFENY